MIVSNLRYFQGIAKKDEMCMPMNFEVIKQIPTWITFLLLQIFSLNGRSPDFLRVLLIKLS